MSVKNDGGNEEATPEQQAFAKFLDVISTEEGRQQFAADPVKALGEEQAENLPGDLKTFLGSLSVEELSLLHRTCKHTQAAGLSSTYGNVTICHL